jgi:DNA-directed RNA polymerase specialized sigma24 family protein
VASQENEDGLLLGRFVTDRDEAAFTALLRRHGPMVLGVARRVLTDEHASEDVLQATFLILARKAAKLDRAGPLGPWLYTVAFHLALRARAQTVRRQSTPPTGPGQDEPVRLEMETQLHDAAIIRRVA